MRAFGTADEAAGSAVAMLADGERLSRLWRYVFVQIRMLLAGVQGLYGPLRNPPSIDGKEKEGYSGDTDVM